MTSYQKASFFPRPCLKTRDQDQTLCTKYTATPCTIKQFFYTYTYIANYDIK